jgi:hypothetical protein
MEERAASSCFNAARPRISQNGTAKASSGRFFSAPTRLSIRTLERTSVPSRSTQSGTVT